MTRSIEFTILNKFTDTWAMKVKMPYDPYKAIYGYYSKYLRRLKDVVRETENAVPENIYSKKVVVKESIRRTVYSWPCGVVIDMPHNATKYDYEILLAQLEVIRMSARK